MQPTAQKLCQAFYLWMLIYKAYAAYSPKALSSLLLVDAYLQSICSLQPKSYVAPFICGCLFTQHMQPTVQKLCQAFYLWTLIHKAKAYALIHKAYAAQKLSQAFYMWMLIHKAKACAAYSPKALQSNLSSKLEYHVQP